MNPLEFFNEMNRSLQESDENAIIKTKSCLKLKEFTFSNEINSKAFIPDPNDEWVQLNRNIIIKINNVQIYEYSDIHYGHYGSYGAGWFVEEEDSSLEQNIMETLSYFEVALPDAVVPKPDQLKINFEKIMSEIYSKNGIDEDSNNDFTYWVIEKAFVTEPNIEGKQLGELSNFYLGESKILNISQKDFDSLINEYYEIYGIYPNS